MVKYTICLLNQFTITRESTVTVSIIIRVHCTSVIWSETQWLKEFSIQNTYEAPYYELNHQVSIDIIGEPKISDFCDVTLEEEFNSKQKIM